MADAILIVGAGHNQVAIVEKARSMGLFTVAMDGNAGAPGLAVADAAEVGDILDPRAVASVASRHGVAGIYCAAEMAVESAARAATDLGLPGVSPVVARRVRHKPTMRRALASAGVPNPRFVTAAGLDEAQAGLEDVGVPAVVKPVDRSASQGVLQVDHAEDLPLAFARARKYARSGEVLIEEYMAGDEFCVDGLVYDGRYILGGITGKERSRPPYRFDVGIHMPPLVDGAIRDAIVGVVRAGLEAVGFTHGTTHVEVIVTDSGPRIVEIAGRPGGGRIPTDLIPLTYGMDYMADALRIALGRPPVERRRFERGAALYWFPCPSGVVVEVRGRDEAAALAGVEELVVSVQPGDVVRHITDCATRDRIGYVMTSAPTAQEAVAVAKRVHDTCRIITRRTR